jgi:hypothetical protein
MILLSSHNAVRVRPEPMVIGTRVREAGHLG